MLGTKRTSLVLCGKRSPLQECSSVCTHGLVSKAVLVLQVIVQVTN